VEEMPAAAVVVEAAVEDASTAEGRTEMDPARPLREVVMLLNLLCVVAADNPLRPPVAASAPVAAVTAAVAAAAFFSCSLCLLLLLSPSLSGKLTGPSGASISNFTSSLPANARSRFW
jgi:hypothetical protein